MKRALLSAFALLLQSRGATISEPATGITLSLSSAGGYEIGMQESGWTFGGNIGVPIQNPTQHSGTDSIGPYDEISSQFLQDGRRLIGVRLYRQKPIVLFTLRFLDAGNNTNRFPSFNLYPRGLTRLSYQNGFAKYSFSQTTTDGPLIEFDPQAHTFILSPASTFPVSITSVGDNQDIFSGVSQQIARLPAGFTQQSILVVEGGINRAFETWGHALTDLHRKVRPSNNEDVTLSHLGYWTDNGATYYYHFEPSLGYEGTLLSIRDEFLAKGVPLGYLQLDSWFYPKGPAAYWKDKGAGIYEYVAAPELFPDGLKAFQQRLALPLVTHARWIDPSSPYRSRYRMSNDVSVDPRYWASVMAYLKDAGVTTYEQDWLSSRARTDFNLTDPMLFFDQMAQAASDKSLTMQYCLPLPSHLLQSTQYSNLTTIRISPDRFNPAHWDRFLYGSRFAGALGIWPWADVFFSSETANLLLATLSAGPVGVGDPLGTVDAENLSRSIRKDGVIVKPDASIIPTDRSIQNDSKGLRAPMIASTYTDFGSVKVAYIFTYPRGADLLASFRPQEFGFSGPVRSE